MDNKNGKNPIKVVKFKIGPLWLIGIAVAAALVAFSLFSRGQASTIGSQINVSDFVQNIKANKYASVDIRDDKKAIATYKYIYPVKTDENIDLSDSKEADVVKPDSFQEKSLDELVDLLKAPTFGDVISSFKGDQSKAIEELVIGDNFIIGKKIGQDGGDILVKNVSPADFNKKLTEKGVSLSNSIVQNVTYVKSAAIENTSVDEIKSLYNSKSFSDIWVIDGTVIAQLSTSAVKEEYIDTNFTQDFAKFLQDGGVNFDAENVVIRSKVTTQIPWGDVFSILSFIGLALLAFFLIRGIQGSGNRLTQFGQTKAKMFFGRKPEVTFDDVAGVDEAKGELQEIVMFLKQPSKFLKMGARIPKGVLMVGSPGTGKTLLARAIAGEAGVPFFHTSGAEFEEMLVGAGASRVRDLFAKAKKAAPALIFIDEIDALARKRGTTVQSSTTEQTLNQILVEMDGFEKNAGVIIVAATNRPDVLDPAILRPGRFDRRIVLDLPDIEGRKQILSIHAKNKPLADGVDLEKVAKRTVGFSGADLENMLNEAAIIAVKENKTEVDMHDIEEAATKVSIGPERKRKRTKEELKMTAYHEAGHAVVAKHTPLSDPVHRITIVSRGMSLGSTMQLPQEDKMQQTKVEMESRLRVLLGGRAAEEIVFKDVTSGASNDIEKATSIARHMVKQFGMSKKLGLVKYGESNELQYLGYGYGEQRDYSEETAKEIDEEVREIMAAAYVEAKAILEKHRKKLDDVSNALLEREVIEGEEFEQLMGADMDKDGKIGE